MRHWKVFSLALVAVLALSAFAASLAQAASPEWYVNGSKLVGTETETSSGGPFTLAVPARGLNIECKKETNTGSITAPRSDKATISFTECILVGAPTCTVSVASTKAATELVLVGGNVYDNFKPETGTTFTTITIAGSGCAAAGIYPVTGETCGKASALGVELVSQPLVFSAANSTACGKELKFGGTKATLSGTSNQVLSGAHKGQKFGAR